MTKSIVITGIGPITAVGLGIEPLWEAMVGGRSAIQRLDRFVEAKMPCPYAAELAADDFNVRKIIPKSHRKAAKVMCRDVALAVGAASAAVADAGLTTKPVDPDTEATIPPHRMGCQIGAGLISAEVEELSAALATSGTKPGSDGTPTFDLAHWGHTGMTNLTPLWLLKYLPNMLACHVTIVHDCRGPSNTITCCEASSALSLGESIRVIERGAADACLTGGAEHKLNPFAYIRQHFADRLADVPEGTAPDQVVKPFSPKATGSVIGEGGGILVIESRESAEGRGAGIYAEVAGFGSTQSFCRDSVGIHIDPDDPSLARCIEQALSSADMTADQVDAIVPFGSGIPHIDALEAAAIKSVFGARAASIPLITTTPIIGNCNAGNGAIDIAVAAKAIREQKLPARIGTTDAEGLDANVCPARDADLQHVLILTTSQGGQNAAVILRRNA